MDVEMDIQFSNDFNYLCSLRSLENICRICFYEEGNTSIFAIAVQNNIEIKIHEVIESCTNSEVNENDDLPKYICEQCLMQLLRTREFLIRCKQSNEILQFITKVEKDKLVSIKQEADEKFIVPVIKPESPTVEVDKIVPRVKCKVCSKTCTKYSMKRHLLTHYSERPFRCETCSAAFASFGNMIRHQRIHTGEKPYKCDLCDKEFTRSNYLLEHKNTHSGIKPYCCDVCAATFYRVTNLKQHLSKHFPLTKGENVNKSCEKCGKRFSSLSAYYTHNLIHSDRCYLCNICGKRIPQKSSFILHYRSHTGEKPFVCNTCSKGFPNNRALQLHVLTHTGEKPHKCSICSKTFAQFSNLKRHRMLHVGIKRHCCDYCGKRFAEKCNLIVHIRTHTGEKPYCCEGCDKRFYDSSSLKKHQRIHDCVLE